MIPLTPDEHLILRWLVFDSKGKIPLHQRNILLGKLDEQLMEDAVTTRQSRVMLIDTL